jgi:hypothetical protein
LGGLGFRNVETQGERNLRMWRKETQSKGALKSGKLHTSGRSRSLKASSLPLVEISQNVTTPFTTTCNL